jgi:hypothetical protein
MIDGVTKTGVVSASKHGEARYEIDGFLSAPVQTGCTHGVLGIKQRQYSSLTCFLIINAFSCRYRCSSRMSILSVDPDCKVVNHGLGAC